MKRMIVNGVLLATLALGMAVSVSASSANRAEATSFNTVDPPQEMRIYQIQHARADEVLNVMNELLGGFQGRLTVDERTNVIIASASAEKLDQAADIIAKLDVRVDETETMGTEMRVYDISDFAPNAMIENIAGVLVSRHPEQIAFEGRRAMLVKGYLSTHEQIEEILAELRSHRKEENASTQRRLRVVWLISGQEDSAPIPRDMQGVAAELARLGIDDMGLAAQAVVQISANSRFDMETIADVGGPCHFQISGSMALNSEGQPDVEIRIETESLTGAARDEMRSTGMNSRIVCPEGHSIVLGVAPMGKATSAFVIQTFEADDTR